MKAIKSLIIVSFFISFTSPAMAEKSNKIDFNSMIESGLDKKSALHADVSEMMEVEKVQVNPKSAQISDFIGNELKALDAQSKVVKSNKRSQKKGL